MKPDHNNYDIGFNEFSKKNDCPFEGRAAPNLTYARSPGAARHGLANLYYW
jgi:hypothetical protein